MRLFLCQGTNSFRLCGYFGADRLLIWPSFSQIRCVLLWSLGWLPFREELVIAAIGDAGCLTKSCRFHESQARRNIIRSVFSVSRVNAAQRRLSPTDREQSFDSQQTVSKWPPTANRSKSVFVPVLNTAPLNAGYRSVLRRQPKELARNRPSNGCCLERRGTPWLASRLRPRLVITV